MNKIKLLMPILGISTIAATAIPLASCACNTGGKIDPDVPTTQKSYSLAFSSSHYESQQTIEKNILYTVTFTVTADQAATLASKPLASFYIEYFSTGNAGTKLPLKKVSAPAGWELNSEGKKIVATAGSEIKNAGTYTFKFYTKSEDIKSGDNFYTYCS